jgi:hypothetical protein
MKNSDLARIFHELEAFIGKAFRGAAVLMLPQAPDNAANGHLGLARKGENFYALFPIGVEYKVSPDNLGTNEL